MRVCLALSLLVGVLVVNAESTPRAAPPASAEVARELVAALSANGLDAIAARDPDAPDRVIAALAFPGSQLLVVAAPYPDAAAIDAWLANRMYREVYSALQQPFVSDGKVFFQDLGCDGLQEGAGGVDVMYENGKTQTIFDGDWKKQKLSQTAYEQRARRADERYTQLLKTLLDAARKGRS
jgi:hypothetical protein